MAITRTETALGKVIPFFSKLQTGYDRLINGVSSDDVVPSLIQYAEVSITAAEMLAARATPKTLVAAPGAGYVTEFLSAVFIYDYTAAFTETADNAAIRYTDGSGTVVSLTLETTGLLDATSDKISTIGKLATDVIMTANAALVFHNTGDGEWGGTGSPCRIKVAYRVHATGL
jgi:hypothetical protein